MPLPADPAARRNHPAQGRGSQGAGGGGRIVESRAEQRGRTGASRCDSGVVTDTGGREGPPQRAPRRVPVTLRALPVGRGRPPPALSPPLPPQWSRPAPADRPGIPAGSPAPPRPPLPPPRAPAPPWETPAASAARRPACHRAAPAASGDFQKKQPDDDSTPSTSNSQSDLFSGETNSDNSNTSLTTQAANSNQQLLTELNVTSPSNEECGPCTGTAHASLTTPTKRSCDSDSQSESEASPVKRPRLLDDSNDRPEETSRSKQKSRRRCFQCQTKLELVQQELGSCRCGYVFCMLHRLPEQHDCTFDHMGRGREEAIMKMVKLDRKVGRSCQRIGEGCS
ncbi:AN1-type zinc finger protein 3 isoform X3 [Falco naumanni]|uniref:AN1-type zinc finger protein 3 isoform X3 n=1 Tax=Falco naumanni TaxID=148594 RepID=UPI001ADE795D|nr:AN1-type zinc finger protein 3 isoform X3 [Falco naumanni]